MGAAMDIEHFWSQSGHAKSASRATVAAGKPAEFLVLHMEHLEQEWSVVAEVLCGIYDYCKRIRPPQFRNFNMGKSSTRWRSEWPDDTRDKIYTMYQDDFEHFGYSRLPQDPYTTKLGAFMLTYSRDEP